MEVVPISATPPKRKHRWFQFSLRTLLVAVTFFAVACGYVGRQLEIEKRRQAWLRENQKLLILDDTPLISVLTGDREKAPSLLRRWIGDEAHLEIWLGRSPSTEQARLTASLFPEADVLLWP
jgi:hypothetical protein